MKKKKMKKQRFAIIAFFVTLVVSLLTSCYHDKDRHGASRQVYNATASDSVNRGAAKRCYSRNFNFVVKRDSLPLIKQQPEETLNGLLTDTMYVYKNDHLVVADIRVFTDDRSDSVWVEVARDQMTMGWVHESLLLASVVPDDPISQFISTFSDTHLLIFLVIISIIAISYLLRIMMKKRAQIVHFNDIGSIYPTFLAVLVATSATYYSSIQLFASATWQQFYFHPSLNPFAIPPVLGLFVSLVWAILILSLAAVDDIKNQLPLPQAVLYLCGLGAICAANYIVFSITTLYYVGYVLLAVYIVFAFKQYLKLVVTYKYVCGNCGRKLKEKGVCPYCGKENY